MEKSILFLRVSKKTKRWLTRLARKQTGYVTQSEMAERVFNRAKKQRLYDKPVTRGNHG